MRQKKYALRRKPIDEQSAREAGTTARSINGEVRKARDWCSLHHNSYPAFVMAAGRLRNNSCDICVEEQNWVRQAIAAMKAEATPITGPELLARAEAMAGKHLRRYKHYDENGEFL